MNVKFTTEPGLPATDEHLYLTELSPKDKAWSTRKAQSLAVADLYGKVDYNSLERRIRGCADLLGFALESSAGSDEQIFRLRDARFCRARHCPICQWRRQLMWLARFKTHVPRIIADYPTHKFIFLTLTVRNCQITELRSTLKQMNYAWNKLRGRKQFPADGWMRNVEVTRADNDYAHPHFHALLMVKSGYFTDRHYLSQEKWTEMWRTCMRIDYDPIVHVQRVKSDYAHNPQAVSEQLSNHAHKVSQPLLAGNSGNQKLSSHAGQAQYHISDDLSKAIFYCLKYSVKLDKGLFTLDNFQASAEWFAELTRQLHKTNAITLGGIFKEYMSEHEPEELVHAEESEETVADNADMRVWFNWNNPAERYVLNDNVVA
jgi:plasmid rolling circle replication initiator protein Rep